MKNSLYILTLLFLSHSIFAQRKTYANEFAEISNAYNNAKNFSAEVVVYSYQKKEQDKAKLLGKGTIRKSDKNYYSRFSGEEMIANNHCAVIVDSLRREVLFYRNSKGQMRDQFSITKIDSLMKRQDSVVYAGVENNEKHYIFYNKRSAMIRVDMYVSEKDHFIKRLTYYYGQPEKGKTIDMYKMDIYYNNIKTDKPDDSYFSEKKVIKYRSGVPILVDAFNKYKLILADQYQPPTQ